MYRLLLFLLLPACSLSADTETSSDMELVAYPVPSGRADEVAAVLGRVLGGEVPTGRATVGPSGEVVVVAPSEVQQGVRTLIQKVAETPAQKSQDIEMEYWLVVGQSGEGERPAELEAIAPALDTIESVAGASRFRVVERIQLRSAVEQNGDASSAVAWVEQYARLAADGSILADVKVECKSGSRLHTRVSLAPEQLLVLGQAGWEGAGLVANGTVAENARETLYYVVRGHVRNAAESR